MIIVDAHLDLAYNALAYGRDLTQPLAILRAQHPDPGPRGIPTVCLPALQEGGVALVFGAIFAMPATYKATGLETGAVYRTPEEAHRIAMAQLDYYHRLVDENSDVRLVTDLASLQEVLASHQSVNAPHSAAPHKPLLGIVPHLEGADPIRVPEEAERWYERGLRAIGLAWDDTRYAAGAWRDGGGGLTKEGRRLLEVMAEFDFIADLTHMSERASLETLEQYAGPVVATHSNVRALAGGERHFSQRQIVALGERGGVMGIVLYNKFLQTGHAQGDPRHLVTLDRVVAHVDAVCQLLGSADHVGIGSDLDGGFGAADIPLEMDSVADLRLIGAKLREKGYEAADVAKIMGGNWVRMLQQAWSA